MEAVTVHIVAEDALLRAGLSAFLSDEDTVFIFSEASDLDQLSANDLSPDDVIIWLVENSMLSRELIDDYPRILALVTDEASAKDCISTGLKNVLNRSASKDKLISAIQALAQGLVVLESAFFPESSRSLAEDVLFDDLTVRELEVLDLLVEGASNKGIAKSLVISENTAKFHVNQLLSKFGVRSRTEVVVRAIGSGIVEL